MNYKIVNKIKKINSQTHLQIHSQFVRFVLMILITLVLICIIQDVAYQKTYKRNEILSNQIILLNEKIDNSELQINKLNNEYTDLEQENQEQKESIKALEAETTDLQQRNYKLSHPQKVYKYTTKELEMLAKLAFHEAGSSDCSDRQQQLIVAVVLCRVQSNKWPDTISDVITQKGQYSSYGTKDWWNDPVPQRCYDNALKVLNGEIKYSNRLTYQSSFKQRDFGSKKYEVYEKYYTPSTGTTTYFCLGD